MYSEKNPDKRHNLKTLLYRKCRRGLTRRRGHVTIQGRKIKLKPGTRLPPRIDSRGRRWLGGHPGKMRICVFCGSNRGNNEVYAKAAQEMGSTLARRGIDLVYGGGRVGLMGVLADAVLDAGGSAIGVIPQALLAREIQHSHLSELHVVATMHERKTKMAGLADGFIALPGGAGTLEEIFEQWTWAQLGIHHKPCGFLNTNGYFDPLREMIGQMTGEGFLRPEHASMLLFDSDPATMLDAFRDYVPPLAKWEAPSTKDEPVRRVI
jgi:uncharacterized protein (TIGR00730 family)